jgi:uncharacterized protein (TIGR00255 family)
MISSMTAFARRDADTELGSFSWELRAVNHRYLEISARLPDDLRHLEGAVRERIAARIGRGKVDCTLRFRAGAAAGMELNVNEDLLRSLAAAVQVVVTCVPQSQAPNSVDLLRWPGVLNVQESNKDAVQASALAVLDEGLDELSATRLREGCKLKEAILGRCLALEERVAEVRRRLPDLVPRLRQRLHERLAAVKNEVDPHRIEQEIVIFSQKIDVAEELDRLLVHLEETRRVLADGGAVGRRLDFLMQEFNREANTLASKAADIEVTRSAVDMKVLIEQMREQVQNIE